MSLTLISCFEAHSCYKMVIIGQVMETDNFLVNLRANFYLEFSNFYQVIGDLFFVGPRKSLRFKMESFEGCAKDFDEILNLKAQN